MIIDWQTFLNQGHYYYCVNGAWNMTTAPPLLRLLAMLGVGL